MSNGPVKGGACWCGRQRVRCGLIWKANGLAEVKDFCEVGHANGGVKLRDVPDWRSLPVERDHRTGRHPCEVCGNPLTELHHWAPVTIFGMKESENWPQSWLCRECHTYWHATMARSGRHQALVAIRTRRSS